MAQDIARMATGTRTRIMAAIRPPSMDASPNIPPMPMIGMIDIMIIGSRIPRAKTDVHGTVSDSRYLSPIILVASSARSEASFSVASLSLPSPDSEAQTHSITACRYPDASRSRSAVSRIRASLIPGLSLTSVLLTASENSSLDNGGPSSATTRTAPSSDPPDSRTEVSRPTTVGPSFISLLRFIGPSSP